MEKAKSYLNEEEKKKVRLSEKQKKAEKKRQLEFRKTKEKIQAEIQTEEDIFALQKLVEKRVVDKDTIKNISSGKEIDKKIIEQIFQKIEEIENIDDIENYIPPSLKITKEDYLKATKDEIFRLQTLTKIDASLVIIYDKINPETSFGINLFSGFLTILDKNLVIIQENSIDIKDSLKKLDEKEDKRSMFQKIVDFIKELFK